MKVFHIGLDVNDPQTGLSRALVSLGELKEINTNMFDLTLESIKIFNEFKPDLVFIQAQSPNIISHKMAGYMKDSGAFVCNFTGDVRSPLPQWYLDLAPFISMSLFTNEDDVQTTRNAGHRAEYLNIGFDETIYKPEGNKLEDKEVVFLGNNYPKHFPQSDHRKNMAIAVKRRYGHLFGLYGAGWNFGNGNYMGNQHGEASVYRGAKIGINCNHINLRRYSSDRNLRIMGSGAFCLAEYYDGIETDFEVGKHLDVWRGIDDLLYKINHWLGKDEERNKIADNGCKLMHSTQTWQHMIDRLKIIYEKEKCVA